MRNPLVVVVGLCSALFSRVSCYNFAIPSNFVLGAATSHYQTEGAWNVSDKSVSINDYWTHRHASQYIVDGSNGDVAADSYHKFKEDVKLVKKLGLDVYRFSISWSRLLPNGYSNNISADGLAYYENLTKELVDNGIKLVVTLHHADHPQSIEDMGGFVNPRIVDLFADYARVVFDAIGSHVDTFITINQPNILCGVGYQDFPPYNIAPGKKLGNYGKYLCMHNALKAHARVWHMYDKEYRSRYKGKIGLSAACYSYQALNVYDMSDYIAAEYGFQFNCGWMWDPIYIGDYPKIMKTRIAAVSTAQGYKKSRLPEFTTEEIKYIRGTSDFIGLNYYYVWTARLQTKAEAAANVADSGIVDVRVNDPQTISVGLYFLLNRISMRYGHPPIYITENGYGSSNYVTVNDYDRISYFHKLLSSTLSAVYFNGVNVIGYIVWSLVDSWEFMNGYTIPYGLYAVDFTSANRTRTPRLSAKWWKSVVAARKLQPVPTSH